MSDWQPITDAQKTGEFFLLRWRDGRGMWRRTVGCWEAEFDEDGRDDDGGVLWRGAWTDYTVASRNPLRYTELQPTHFALAPLPKGVSSE